MDRVQRILDALLGLFRRQKDLEQKVFMLEKLAYILFVENYNLKTNMPRQHEMRLSCRPDIVTDEECLQKVLQDFLKDFNCC